MPSWCERDLTYSRPFRQERAVGSGGCLSLVRRAALQDLQSLTVLTVIYSSCSITTASSPAGFQPRSSGSATRRAAMSKDAASSSLPAPLRAIVGVLTLALRAVQLVVRRRRHAPQHSPRLAHKRGAPQVATGLIYFIFCQGTMLAKEQKFIKKVPPIVNEVRAGSTTPLDACPSYEYTRSACRGRTAAS